MTIAVVGAGAFGTALALVLAERHPVVLWTRSAEQARAMQTTRQSGARLPGHVLPDRIRVTDEIAHLSDARATLLSLPSQALRPFLGQHGARLPSGPVVCCNKGIDLVSLSGPTGTVLEARPDLAVAILTGPSFATDLANGLPTALTMATTSPDAEKLQALLSTDSLRLYLSDDPKGAELCGALKNVIAIGCGAVIGAGLGESARAALMTRGFFEMQRVVAALGGNPATANGLCGFGDLALTCTSEQSRNFRFGVSLGRGTPFDAGMTVEGMATAKALKIIAKNEQLDLPVSTTVAGLCEGHLTVAQARDTLLQRPLRKEQSQL